MGTPTKQLMVRKLKLSQAISKKYEIPVKKGDQLTDLLGALPFEEDLEFAFSATHSVVGKLSIIPARHLNNSGRDQECLRILGSVASSRVNSISEYGVILRVIHPTGDKRIFPDGPNVYVFFEDGESILNLDVSIQLQMVPKLVVKE